MNNNLYNHCTLCPNNCNLDRSQSIGACGAEDNIKIAKYYLHKFEEPCISGKKGSGTIFFCGCSLRCVFCQNFSLSRNQRGKVFSIHELVNIFKELEKKGANNINLVTPTHYIDKIVQALNIYRPHIPVVYNTHSYEKTDNLKKIDPFVDIYLPDMKFFSSKISFRYTGKKNYFNYASRAIEFMSRKPLKFDKDGNMLSGTLVRHLVLPQNITDSKKILDWYSDSGIKNNAYLNVMSQYTPFGDIKSFPELNRKLTKREYDSVIDYALSLDIKNMYYQKFSSASEIYIPSWDY